MKINHIERISFVAIFALAFCIPVIALAGPQDEESSSSRLSARERFSKTADEFSELVKPVVGSAADSTVAIIGDYKNGRRKKIAFGTVVDAEGFILTKASELSGVVECEFANGEKFTATVYGVDHDTDLALLKVDATGLPAVSWSETALPQTGQWLVTPDVDGEPAGIGVVGVDAREIPPTRAFIGIRPLNAPDDSGVLIGEVIPGTPADRAGLMADDVIKTIDGETITDRMALQAALAQYDPNDPIKMMILRDEEEVELSFNLADETNVNPDFDRSNSQNSMGSKLSRRRRDFPLAVQHDSQLQANECGGPIVDLSGRVVGMNIARSGRVYSLFLPAETVVPVIARLKTGEFSPEVVNEANIAKTREQLRESARLAKTLPRETKKLSEKIELDNGRQAELKRMIEEFQARLKSLEEEAVDDRLELKSMERKLDNATKSQERLKNDLRKLKEGS